MPFVLVPETPVPFVLVPVNALPPLDVPENASPAAVFVIENAALADPIDCEKGSAILPAAGLPHVIIAPLYMIACPAEAPVGLIFPVVTTLLAICVPVTELAANCVVVTELAASCAVVTELFASCAVVTALFANCAVLMPFAATPIVVIGPFLFVTEIVPSVFCIVCTPVGPPLPEDAMTILSPYVVTVVAPLPTIVIAPEFPFKLVTPPPPAPPVSVSATAAVSA